ncbi:MAG: LamB/YcsF family protein [Chitinophagaceae bacterium]|nr:LamB/YcsF family protein [Chitinophagaceae bacterium]
MLGKIDLNCDMGEGFATDALIMPLISSANIACGYHAGGGELMQQTIRLAMQHQVAIGAHPSFNDRDGFGRREMQLYGEEIHEIVSNQVNSILKAAEAEGAKLSHVKPHGALYNMAANDPMVADAISRAIKEIDASLIVYGLPDSASESSAKAHGLKFYREVFSDRTYTNEGRLTPRQQQNALIETVEQCIAQVLQVVVHQTIKSTDGQEISIQADTICIHGDGEHAVAFAQLIKQSLDQQGIAIKQ